MSRPKINKPVDVFFRGQRLSVWLKWNKARFTGGGGGGDGGNSWQARFDNAQKFVDSEVLRLSEPFIPLRTGMLIKSGILGTQVGSGEVKWIAPYARYQYYAKRKPGSDTEPLRGPFWFHRMKAIHGEQIVQCAKEIIGRRKGGTGGA
jgi:hypothetical protein